MWCMADDKAVAGGVLPKIPVFNEEVRKIFTALLDGGVEKGIESIRAPIPWIPRLYEG